MDALNIAKHSYSTTKPRKSEGFISCLLHPHWSSRKVTSVKAADAIHWRQYHRREFVQKATWIGGLSDKPWSRSWLISATSDFVLPGFRAMSHDVFITHADLPDVESRRMAAQCER